MFQPKYTVPKMASWRLHTSTQYQSTKSFTVVISLLSTRLIKPNFCFDLSHRRSTTVSLETRNLFFKVHRRVNEVQCSDDVKTLTDELWQCVIDDFSSASTSLITKQSARDIINLDCRCHA